MIPFRVTHSASQLPHRMPRGRYARRSCRTKKVLRQSRSRSSPRHFRGAGGSLLVRASRVVAGGSPGRSRRQSSIARRESSPRPSFRAPRIVAARNSKRPVGRRIGYSEVHAGGDGALRRAEYRRRRSFASTRDRRRSPRETRPRCAPRRLPGRRRSPRRRPTRRPTRRRRQPRMTTLKAARTTGSGSSIAVDVAPDGDSAGATPRWAPR